MAKVANRGIINQVFGKSFSTKIILYRPDKLYISELYIGVSFISISNNLRAITAFILIVLEMLAVSFSVDASLIKDGGLSWLLSSMGIALRWLIVFIAVLILIFYFRHKTKSKLFAFPLMKPFSFFSLPLHLVFFGLFFAVSLSVFNPETSTKTPWQFVWLILTVLVLSSWVNLLTSFKEIFAFCLTHETDLLISAIVAAIVITLNFYARSLWEPLSLATLNGAEWVLSLLFNDIYIDAPEKLLGVNEFIVHISAECSGLEGLVIALSVTSIYLFLLRDSLRFPLVILLLPIATLLAVVFNIIRVAVLISIGAFFSPEIAVGGFHSVAGWFTAVLVSFLIVFVFTSMSVFNNKSSHDLADSSSDETEINSSDDSQLAWAMLVPFVLFLITTLLSSIFVDDFNYFYPLKVIVGGLSLAYFWSFYEWDKTKKWVEPVLAGFVVAILWVILVPVNLEYDLNFTDTIKSMPLWMMLGWCLFRVTGFWFIAPILEELVFRGYLIARLSKQPLLNNNQLKFSLVALTISSLIFGFIHNNIIAGIVAGVVFAVVRYRHNSLAEPIISHISANVFITIWAFTTGQWSLL
ncbi:MAG: exosortase E/protease (VPEID-CTERM system) [Glaciecola sp.]